MSEFACCLDKILNKGEEPVVSAGCCSRCVHRGSRSTIFLVPQDVHESRSDRETTTHKIIKRYLRRYEGIPRRYFAGQEIKLSVTKSYHYLQTKVKEIKLMVQSNYISIRTHANTSNARYIYTLFPKLFFTELFKWSDAIFPSQGHDTTGTTDRRNTKVHLGVCYRQY